MSGKKPVFKYPGRSIDVFWDGRLCIHIGECGRAEGDLFVGGRKPWCQPDVATVEDVADVCERCPTGALSYKVRDGSREERASAVNTVTVVSRGPLYFRGRLQIDGVEEDQPGLRYRAALCRCGQSGNKPFCDNSHEKAGFSDYGAVGSTGETAAGPSGPLEVKAAPDGPLIVSGNFTIVAGTGREAWRGGRAALCRCGESANKPFCDGSHKAAGFKA